MFFNVGNEVNEGHGILDGLHGLLSCVNMYNLLSRRINFSLNKIL